MKILFISLGCDKNLVDTETMLGYLSQKGYEITDDETEAEAVVVNTCCFIHDAKQESVDAILEMARENILLDGITLSGGEPFAQAAACAAIAKGAHASGLNVWCYTGYTFETLLEGSNAIISDEDEKIIKIP